MYLIEVTQDRQCSIDVTLGRLALTIVAVEKQELLYILSVCLQP
jgi:hypothetical protein